MKPAITLKVRIQRRTDGGNGLLESRPGGTQTRAGRLSSRWSWSDVTLVVGPGACGVLGKGLRGASSPHPAVNLPWVTAQPPYCGTETAPLTRIFWVSLGTFHSDCQPFRSSVVSLESMVSLSSEAFPSCFLLCMWLCYLLYHLCFETFWIFLLALLRYTLHKTHSF